MQLSEVAKSIGGELTGDGSVQITGVAPINQAGPTELAFLSNPGYAKYLGDSKAAAVIVATDTPDATVSLIRCADPYDAFRLAMILMYGARTAPMQGIDPGAAIDPDATVADGVTVGRFVTICAGAGVGANTVLYPGVFIGPAANVGADCVLYPNVVIYEQCVLGDRVTIHANSVIGQDGFGYVTDNGVHQKIPQAGIVRIGDDVEIGAGCTIDRATIGATEIGAGTKFSNAVAIGHGTKIGPGNLMVAQTGIAGSTTTGKYCVFGGQAGIVGHVTLGDFVSVGAQAGVTNDVPANTSVWGTPAAPLAEAKRQAVLGRQLPKIKNRINELERELNRLKRAVGESGDRSE